WRRVLNEVQITLHEHPVNLARTARGLPAVNSLWPWGEGRLDTDTPDWNLIEADCSLWQGLARHPRFTWRNLPQAYQAGKGNTLAVQPALEASARQRDALQWLSVLQDLERNWFAPLMQALQSGALKELVVHGHGEGQALTLTVSGRNALNFWHKPAPLTALGVAQQQA